MSPRAKKPIDRYARISDDPDNTEAGVRRQDKLVCDLLKGRGHGIGELIIDNDTSAHSGVFRPGFAKLCERMRSGESGGVAAYHWKRLLRRPREMEDFIDLIEQTGAIVLTVASGDVDLTTAAGRAVARIFGSLGAMESEEISERMKARFRQEADEGRPHGRGPRPFGYEDDWQTPHPVEAPVYRELFESVIQGVSLGQIARDWEARGFLNRKGIRYSVSSLRCLVRSPRAIGMRQHRGEIVAEGDWEPIVTKEVQEAAKSALRSRARHQLRGSSTKRPARLLSSLIVCGKCGQTLRIRKQKGGVFYACDRGNNGKACGGVMVRTELVEAEVEKRYLALLKLPKTHKTLEKLRRQRPDTKKILDEIDHLQLEIDAAAEDLGAGRISRKVWQAIHEGTTSRLEAANAKLAKVENNPTLLAVSPIETARIWRRLDLDERRRRLAAFVNSVSVEPLNGGGGARFVPERIGIDWRI